MTLNKSAFMNANAKLKKELVELPELDGSVYIREMSGKQLLQWNEKIIELQEKTKEITPLVSVELMCLLLSFTVCDEDGNLLFTIEDVNELSNNSINLLTKLSKKSMEISGIRKEVSDEVNSQLKNVES